jgi:ABC-2 type transport system permease protein
MIAAILRAQWLSMRMGANRAAAFRLITGLIWYGVWTGLACGMFLLVSSAPSAALYRFLPIGLLGICVYWQAMPILSASMGSSLDMRKLLVYPAPHGKLFLVEVLLRLTTGIEMLMILAGGTAGLLRNRAAGGWSSLPRVLGPVLIYVLFNLLLASGTRSLLERLLSRRKVRELLVFFLLMLWMVPRFVMLSGQFGG